VVVFITWGILGGMALIITGVLLTNQRMTWLVRSRSRA
jgi:hypothetical protein